MVEQVQDRMGRYTHYVYDQLKHLVYQFDPAGRGTSYGYDAVGSMTWLQDGNGSSTYWSYDARYRMVRKTYADGSNYRYTYDGVGNLKTRIDAKGVTTTYNYDDTDNLTGILAPGMMTISFGYDEVDRRTSMTDSVGSTSFGYDDAGQMTSVDGPWASDTVTLGYDALGRETSRQINGAANNVSTSYDAYDRIGSVTNPLGVFTLGYTGTATTRLASVSYPNGQTANYTYYGSGGDQRLQTIWNKGTSAGTTATLSKFDYEYDKGGNITKWTQEGYTTSVAAYEFGHDPVNELQSALRKQVSNGAVLNSAGYTYDLGGNRTSEQVDGTLTTAAHNNLNQVTSRTGGNGVLPIKGTTDEAVKTVKVNGQNATLSSEGKTFAGKTNVVSGNNTVTVQATDGAGNTKTSQYQVTVGGSGTTTPSYDLNGNMINDGVGRTYEWTPLDQLAAINQGTLRTEFTYDGLSRRVKIVEKNNGSVTATRNFVWIGMQIAEERDIANTIVKQYHCEGFRQGATNYYYLRDHLGSIREVSDTSRTLLARYDYDPYGRRNRIAGSIEVDHGFSGLFSHNGSSLGLASYRIYDATFARWLSRDPVNFFVDILRVKNGDLLQKRNQQELGRDGSNQYAYVKSQPLILVDLNGTYSKCCQTQYEDMILSCGMAAFAGIGALALCATTPFTGFLSAIPCIAGALGAGFALADCLVKVNRYKECEAGRAPRDMLP